ncbi:TIGR02647 family protein [Porticoccus litoralis]|jgi:uncharacterized protein (TIGR02647 family)|uniref:TIGR02647 family protein n=1 Tax=Porticoccus litoralis TaxID=434086 RepID=A0AAW8B2X6_9GAMM|nr:TIGR02647 family protein [Porticoccus litoralis]MDP1520253.1 TIGR02647 family protein [Porticoccus litoralis]
MPFSSDHLDELNLLSLFDTHSLQNGIKVHSHEAPTSMVEAARRLYKKGLITQVDGGYLTDLGFEAMEHALKLLGILSTQPTMDIH